VPTVVMATVPAMPVHCCGNHCRSRRIRRRRKPGTVVRSVVTGIVLSCHESS
jgi:hypothetical protein